MKRLLFSLMAIAILLALSNVGLVAFSEDPNCDKDCGKCGGNDLGSREGCGEPNGCLWLHCLKHESTEKCWDDNDTYTDGCGGCDCYPLCSEETPSPIADNATRHR